MPKPLKPRHQSAQTGRYCGLCGRGMDHRRGGLDAAGPALAALGYTFEGQAYAHVRCLQRARNKPVPMRFVIPEAKARKMTRTEYYAARSYCRKLTRELLK